MILVDQHPFHTYQGSRFQPSPAAAHRYERVYTHLLPGGIHGCPLPAVNRRRSYVRERELSTYKRLGSLRWSQSHELTPRSPQLSTSPASIFTASSAATGEAHDEACNLVIRFMVSYAVVELKVAGSWLEPLTVVYTSIGHGAREVRRTCKYPLSDTIDNAIRESVRTPISDSEQEEGASI